MPLTHLPDPRTPSSADAPALRWGFLGPGWIADQMAASLRRHTTQVLQAVASRDLARAEDFARRWEVATAYGSYEQLVADPDIDAVYVATPHHLHLPHALLAIGAGKPVLVEKPVGLDADEARMVADAAAAAGVFAMEAMWTLFLPKFDVLRRLRDDGALGELRSVLADIGEAFDPTHRIFLAELAGGPMLDLGTYPATLVTWLLGNDLVVQGAVGAPAPNGINGQISATLSGPGSTAQLHATILGETPTTATVVGSEGSLWLDRHFYRPGPFTVLPRGGEPLTWTEPRVDHDGLHYEVAEAARCIAAGSLSSPVRPLADTVATLGLMDTIRERAGITYAAGLRD